MKNLINKVNNTRTAVVSRVNTAVMTVTGRAKAALTGNNGDGFVDTAMKILISVVLGAIILVGLVALFDETILPAITNKVKEMFTLG